MGVLGLDLRRAGRGALMDQIGAVLAIPHGGWHGQARLFDGPDLRLRWLLRRLSKEHEAKLVAGNLARAGRYVTVNLMLAVVSAAREADPSLTATGTDMVETFNEGGLDFLWREKNKLGLPGAITQAWQKGMGGVSPSRTTLSTPQGSRLAISCWHTPLKSRQASGSISMRASGRSSEMTLRLPWPARLVRRSSFGRHTLFLLPGVAPTIRRRRFGTSSE